MKTTVERPADSAGELYRRVDISPEELFRAIAGLRKEAMAEIDRLLAFLDELDGDTDLEPSLEGYSRGMDDREDDRADDEPSLGSVDGGRSGQVRWAEGNTDEREGDGCADDREGDELLHGGEGELEDLERGGDEEPSLGWTVDGIVSTSDGMDREGDETGRGKYASRPQNRTRLRSSVAKMRKLRCRMRGGYLDALRFDQTMTSMEEQDEQILAGNELAYPGGQPAFAAMMRDRWS